MDGEIAALLSTDPPYCVDYTGMDRPIHDGKPSGKDWSHVYREVDIKDLGQFLDGVFTAVLPHVVEDAAIYVWHAHVQQPVIAATFERHGLLLHQILVWVLSGAPDNTHYPEYSVIQSRGTDSGGTPDEPSVCGEPRFG